MRNTTSSETRNAASALVLSLVPLLLLAGPVPSARADIIHLRNGSQITGTVVEESGGILKVDIGGGIMTLRRSEVLYIERESGTERLLSGAKALSSAGRLREAMEKLEEARRHGATSETVLGLQVEFLKIEASRLEAAGRFAEALKTLARAKRLDPADTDIARWLDRLENSRSQMTRVFDEATRAMKAGDYLRAVEVYERALRDFPGSRSVIQPELARAYRFAADKLVGEGRPEALELLEKAKAAAVEWDEAFRKYEVLARLSVIYRMRDENKLEEAFEASKKLLGEEPDLSFVRYQYVVLLGDVKKRGLIREELYRIVPEEERAGKNLFGSSGRKELWRLARVKAQKDHREFYKSIEREKLERSRVDADAARELGGRYFAVRHRNEKLAREVLDAADRQAERILRELGESVRSPWGDKPCVIHMLPDKDEYLKETGMPEWSAGMTSTEAIGRGLIRHHVVIYQTGEKLLRGTVPHEVAHVVLFALTDHDKRIPLAFHEGFAVSREPGFKAGRDDALLRRARLFGDLIPLRELLMARHVGPSPGLFYAQSASLVRFLADRKGLRVFLEFLKDFAGRGSTHALGTRYSFTDIEALEKAWLDSLGG